MHFLIKFAEKPNHSSKKVAIQIARDCNCKFQDGVYFVQFDEINQNLIKLLNLSHNWNTAEFIVDHGMVDPNKVCDILFCRMYEKCNGVCQKVELIPNYNLSFFINRLRSYITQGSFPDPRSYECQIIDGNYVKKTDDPEFFRINKDVIVAEVKKQLKIPLIYCDKIDERKCLDPIESLPDKVKYKPTIDINFINNEITNEKFEGFSEAVADQIRAEAEIKAPIYAKAIAKELEEILKKNR